MGNFATVGEVKEALARCTVWTPAVAAQGSATIHLAITDRTGAGIVVEWVRGKQNIPPLRLAPTVREGQRDPVLPGPGGHGG
jgi:penicillin V acylase-like amidase (Ntn superfamily)